LVFGLIPNNFGVPIPVSDPPVESAPRSSGLLPLAMSEDRSIGSDLYGSTCFTYPCDDFLSAGSQGPSPFPSVGIRPNAAEPGPLGSSVFLTSKDGQVILIDGMPLGANAIGENPRYNLVEDDSGNLVSVCDNSKKTCFIPSRLELKSPSDVPIILRTYEDIMEERASSSGPAPHDDSSGPDFTAGDPETRDPGVWNSCRSAGVSGDQAPDNSRACLNAYNNGVDSMGRKDFIPVDCSSNFVGPLQPSVSAQCKGRVVNDLNLSESAEDSSETDAGASAKEEDDNACGEVEDSSAESLEDLLKEPAEGVEPEPAKEDSPEASKEQDPKESTAVPLEQVSAFNTGAEGPGEEVLPKDVDQAPQSSEPSAQTIEVGSDAPSDSDSGAEAGFVEDEDESFYKGSWVDSEGNLQEVENEKPSNKGEDEALDDFLGGEAQTLEAQSRAWEKKKKASKTPGELELEEPQNQGQSPKSKQPQEKELSAMVDAASEELLTRDDLTGVIRFKENSQGLVVMGQTIKSKPPLSKRPGAGGSSLTKEQILKEFNFTEPQYEEYVKNCKKATQDFQTGTLMNCLRENLDKFADFLIKSEE